jgi:desulfoferrodoxin-like iron-binding protein
MVVPYASEVLERRSTMSDNVSFENAVTEVNEGIVEEVHSIEDIESASDFELKHTPNVEVIEGASGQTIKVTIGLKGIAHPQTEEHLIEWIRAFDGDEPIGTVSFGPEDTPAASFEVPRTSNQIIVQALCNLHGLWEARI